MKNLTLILLISLLFIACQGQKKDGDTKQKDIITIKKLSFTEHLKSFLEKNTTEIFDIEKLKTDDFSNMLPMNKKLFQTIYPNRNDYADYTFFIYSYLEANSNDDILTLITYYKNFEIENLSVDQMDLISVDADRNKLDEIRLTTKDNSVITYEVVSALEDNIIKTTEKISSEYYKSMDTLYTNEYTFKLNSKNRIDTVDVKRSLKVRQY